jgi:hypothetical protein
MTPFKKLHILIDKMWGWSFLFAIGAVLTDPSIEITVTLLLLGT